MQCAAWHLGPAIKTLWASLTFILVACRETPKAPPVSFT